MRFQTTNAIVSPEPFPSEVADLGEIRSLSTEDGGVDTFRLYGIPESFFAEGGG